MSEVMKGTAVHRVVTYTQQLCAALSPLDAVQTSSPFGSSFSLTGP